MPTKIEWARNPDGSKGETWPVVTGCTPVSEGCRNCYAARMAATRLKHHPRYEGLATIENGRARWMGEVRLNHDVLEQPLHWRKPRMVFVASMGDLFHEDVPADYIGTIVNIIRRAPQHTFQILTKRARRMAELSNWLTDREGWPGNTWLGTSIENQATADERVPLLLQTPAAVRFVSVEPMLGEIDLDDVRPGIGTLMECSIDALRVQHHLFTDDDWSRNKLDWVICGAESGPGARPMDEDWVRDLRDQCQAAGTPFFYKQAICNGRRVHMPELDGQVWDQFPVSVLG